MTQESNQRAGNQTGTDAHRDPLSGTPVGTGVLVAGPEASGLAGKGVAKKMDPTVEDTYWKNNYAKQPYVDRNADYSTYQLAYRIGYEGRSQYPGKTYEEVEAILQRDYEQSNGNAGLSWNKARHATRDAWHRIEKALPGDADGDGR